MALEFIEKVLANAGYSEIEINHIIAAFLEQEAEKYVNTIKAFKSSLSK